MAEFDVLVSYKFAFTDTNSETRSFNIEADNVADAEQKAAKELRSDIKHANVLITAYSTLRLDY